MLQLDAVLDAAMSILDNGLANSKRDPVLQQFTALLNHNFLLIREKTLAFYDPGLSQIIKDISLARRKFLS